MRASRSILFASIAVMLCAAAFLGWVHALRVAHVDHVSAIMDEAPRVDARSPTGLAGETRTLIVPAHHR
ncbi:MAG TPA: hypothetical protein VEA63_08030, partial [Opitutus sp.]|nr:hypothetical protein [Opitutus sp.]